MARKILVIDDNPDTRDLTHLHLTTEGFVVVVASDGREGPYMAQKLYFYLSVRLGLEPTTNGCTGSA